MHLELDTSGWRINGLWSQWFVKAITLKTSKGVKIFNRLCMKHLKHLVLLFLFQLYIFLFLLHLVSDFQNYLRTQTGNNTTVNIIISTVDYLLRVQVSVFSSQLQCDKNPILLWGRFSHRSLGKKNPVGHMDTVTSSIFCNLKYPVSYKAVNLSEKNLLEQVDQLVTEWQV